MLNFGCPQLQSITAYEISCKLMNSPKMGKKAHVTSQQSGQGHVRESSKNDLIINVLLSLKPLKTWGVGGGWGFIGVEGGCQFIVGRPDFPRVYAVNSVH